MSELGSLKMTETELVRNPNLTKMDPEARFLVVAQKDILELCTNFTVGVQ